MNWSGTTREYIVGTEDERGGTKTVAVVAESADDARSRINEMGHHAVWTMPEK